MSIPSKSEKVIKKLISETRDDAINWEVVSTERLRAFDADSDDTVDVAYACKYEGEDFVVLKRKTQEYSGEYDRHYWTESVEVWLADSALNLQWQFPRSTFSRALLDSASVKALDVENRLSKLLDDESTDEEE